MGCSPQFKKIKFLKIKSLKKKKKAFSVLASCPPPSAHPGLVATSCSASSELRSLLLALRISAGQVPTAPRRVTIAGTGHQMPVPQSLRCLAQQAPADLLGQPLPLLLTLLGQLGQQLQEEEYHRQSQATRRPAYLLPACPSSKASPWAPLLSAVGESAAARPQGVPAAAFGPPPAVGGQGLSQGSLRKGLGPQGSAWAQKSGRHRLPELCGHRVLR